MLNARHRLRLPADFSAVIRRGSRAGRPALVVHLLLADGVAGADTPSPHVPATTPARVGFVVPRAVGSSVTRNLVVRRLRALWADRIETVPPGSRIVVRALGPAAVTAYAALAEQLDTALASAVRRAQVVPR